MPKIVRIAVAFYDFVIPILLGRPITAKQISTYKKWQKRMSPTAQGMRQAFLLRVKADVQRITVRAHKRRRNNQVIKR